MASPLQSLSRRGLLLLLSGLFLLPMRISSAQPNYRNITAGTTLSPLVQPTSWLSPTGDFAFGFLPHPANSSLFLLAVWFNLLLPNTTTVVWCANGDTPVPAASTATLKPNGQFSLVDPSGQEIWNPGVSKNISRVSILDTGNLVFAASDSTILWQSFDHPTDTIMPGQVLTQGTEVFSRLMDTDYTTGRFELTMQDDGNLVMYLVAFPSTSHYHEAYWDTATVAPGVRLVYNESGSIYLAYVNNTVVNTVISTPVSGDQYHRATLDPDGIFRQYTFPKNEPSTGSWVVKETIASNICGKLTVKSGSGACGFNSYCTMDGGGRVECTCAPNYSFIDPDRKYLGCKPNFAAQSCEPGGEASFDFEVVPNLDWPEADFEILRSVSETDCRSNCLKDCFCPAFVHSYGNCWKKKYPLSNGRSGTNILPTTLVKYSTNSSVPSSSSQKRDRRTWTTVATLVFLGGSMILNLAFLGLCFRRSSRTSQCASSAVISPALFSFTYKELEEATEGFSEELGKGAFGTVYKGKLASEPEVLIAVKKLKSTIEMEAAEKDFTNETRTIGLTHHKNLVRLLGFCNEGTHRLLVYEFMSNGSLDKLLFGSDSPDWNQRIQLALGVGRGLAYLHEECRTQIIHCDIKPQNILVDDNLDARISDFGLAKLLRLEQTRTNTGIRGTIGYFAPEWFKNSAITAKVDVYSFGVVLLEIICCRRNLDFDYGYGSEVKPALTCCAMQCYRDGRVDLLVENDEEAKKDGLRLERFVTVAISCIQEDPALRPSMKKVVQMLEGTIEVVIPPIAYSLSM